MPTLMPDYIYRQFDNDGKLLSGGKIYFYQSGTTTPKTVFQDADGLIPLTNPVILDASGSETIFLGSGAYRIKVTDLNDVQVAPPVDGIVGSGIGTGGVTTDSTATATLLETYNQLRSLTTTPDLVYVSGRTIEGDGGAGWFQYLPTSSLVDDDCIILTAQSGSAVYKRIFDGYIDPQWRGLVYDGSIDQTNVLTALGLLSEYWGCPVLITKPVFINQNILIRGSIKCADGGYFNSTLSVTMTFLIGSYFTASGPSFGVTVSPIFQRDTVEEILYSWMAGTVTNDKLTKLLNSNTTGIKLVVDIGGTISFSGFNFALSTTNPFEIRNGSIMYFGADSGFSINLPGLVNTDPIQLFSISTGASISSISFGKKEVYPEFFGALCNGTADDSFPFWQAAYSGYVALSTGKTYHLKSGSTPPAYPTSMKISGEGTIKLYGNKTLGNGQLWIYNATVIQDTNAIWFNGTWLKAISALFPSNYTATSSLIDGCVYTDKNKYPVYDGQPSIYNAHLPLLPSCQLLGTDVTSKIVSAGPDLTLRNVTMTSLTLTSGTIDNLKPSKFAPIIATPTGTSATLSPAYSYNLIDNSAGQKDVILPSDPTAVYFKLIGKTGYNNIRVGCTGADTFYTGATTFLINGSGVGVASMELFRVGTVWYPIFSQL